MHSLNPQEKQLILDEIGKIIIKEVRDRALLSAINIAKSTTPNPIKLNTYKALSNLTDQEQESVCDLLSETITDTIYLFLEMFEEYNDLMQFNVNLDGSKIDLTDISEKMGSEIACYNENGWIQKFSKIGRFIL